MRTLHLLVIAAAAALIARRASAELVIYKGTLKQSAVGLGVARKISSQYYLIVDHDTAETAQIQYSTVNKNKTYATITETNLHIIQVSGPKGKNSEALAHTPDDCETAQGDTADGVFVQGTDGLLKVGGNSTITFPKILTGSGKEIVQSGGPIYVESTLVASFDGKQTPLSNGNGETVEAAVVRISAVLEGQGYIQQKSNARKSMHPLDVVQPEP